MKQCMLLMTVKMQKQRGIRFMLFMKVGKLSTTTQLFYLTEALAASEAESHLSWPPIVDINTLQITEPHEKINEENVCRCRVYAYLGVVLMSVRMVFVRT